MGKKRTVNQKGQRVDRSLKARTLSRLPKKKLSAGRLYVRSTFNNTIGQVADNDGNIIMSSSSGSLGFKGAKKGTPFAAAKVGEVLGEKAKLIGLKEVDVFIIGIGSGRESLVRGFSGFGIELRSIQDRTPLPHNGCRPRKARRV